MKTIIKYIKAIYDAETPMAKAILLAIAVAFGIVAANYGLMILNAAGNAFG